MFSDLMNLTEVGDHCFEAPPPPDKGVRVFGGQILAQSLTAAQRTVGPERDAHSLHAYFLRPADVQSPMRLQVEVLRSGRSFSSTEVVAWQADKALCRVMISFQVLDEGPVYAGSEVPDAPPPEDVAITYHDFLTEQNGRSDWPSRARPMEIRYINPPGARGIPITEAQLMWMRIPERLSEHPGIHRAGLAYLSDSTLADHILLPHGLRWHDDDFSGASLDHAMWFHEPARADDWVLFEQKVEATGRGRGLASGRFFTRAGKLICTCTQEGLMRWVKP